MKPVPNRAPKKMQVDAFGARLRAERSALNDSMGKVGTGANKSKAEKRNTTRTDQKRNAIRDSKDN
jgi:hypothetical protein